MNNIVNTTLIQPMTTDNRPIADKPGLQPNLHRWQYGDIVFKRGTELDIANALYVVETNILPPPGQLGVMFLCPYFQRVDALTGRPLNSAHAQFLPVSELYHYSEFGLKLMAEEFDQYLLWKRQSAMLQPQDNPPHTGGAIIL